MKHHVEGIPHTQIDTVELKKKQKEEFENDFECTREGVRSYRNTVSPERMAKDITRDLKHVLASFGFEVRIRSSSHSGTQNETLKRIDFRCVERHPGCPFRLTVKRNGGRQNNNDENDEKFQAFRSSLYVFQFYSWHNHGAEYNNLQKTVPSHIWNEAVRMKDISVFPTELIIRHLEDQYGMVLRRDVFSRKLRYEMRKRYPRDNDCSAMLAALVQMQQNDPRTFLRVQTVGSSLRAVCWGHREWLEDYHSFGVVPGVSLDAKALATSYDTPFVSIGGRDHNGKLVIFFAGFIPNERQESMLWLLQCFKEFAMIAPRLVCCDQDGAILAALQHELPDSLVTLDHWHLNQNQKKNCLREAKKMEKYLSQSSENNLPNCATKDNPISEAAPQQGSYRDFEFIADEELTASETLAKRLQKALYKLRKSATAEEFFQDRKKLEREFFAGRELPTWYFTLYHRKMEMVVRCFNRRRSGYTFKFQGSGYSESLNSLYKKLVQDRRLPFSRVPEELYRHFQKLRLENGDDLRKVKFFKKAHRTLFKSLGLEDNLCYKISELYTNYALQLVFEKVIPNSSMYAVQLVSENFPLLFDVKSGNGDEFSTSHVVKLEQFETKYEDMKYLRPSCTCFWFNSYGLPCVHIVRVCIIVSRDTSENVSLDLERCFHPYWIRRGGGWRIGEYEISGENILLSHEEEGNEKGHDEHHRIRLEREIHSLWSSGRSTWNQIHRRVSVKGVKALRDLDKAMDLLCNEVNKTGSNDDLNVVGLIQRLSAAVEQTFQKPIEMTLTKANVALVTNTNAGNPRGRGTNKRAISYVEKLNSSHKMKGKRQKISSKIQRSDVQSNSRPSKTNVGERLLYHMKEPPYG